MKQYIIYAAIFLGFVALIAMAWAGAYWWNNKYGRKSALLNERIGLLSEKNRAAAAAAPIFKEPLFSENPDFNDLLKKIPAAHKLNDLILKAGGTYIVHEFLIWQLLLVSVSFIVIWIFMDSALAGLWGALLSAAAPFVYLIVKNRSRKVELEKQLPDLLDFISRSLSAGHAFNSALQNAALQSPDPIGAEFKMCFDQLNIGIPLREAMGNLVKRIDTDDVRFFSIAVVINREVGGNLAELLGDVSKLIRERLTTRMVINTLTAEGRTTAKFLGALPIVAFLGLSLIMPGYFDPVLKSDFGMKLFVMTAIWAIFGFLWMRVIANVRL
jgi:tight adherence protein B